MNAVSHDDSGVTISTALQNKWERIYAPKPPQRPQQLVDDDDAHDHHDHDHADDAADLNIGADMW